MTRRGGMKIVGAAAWLVAAAMPVAAEPAAPTHKVAVMIEYDRYKPGSTARVAELNERYFYPSWRASGMQVHILTLASGEWDMMFIFPLKEGFAALNEATLPEFVASRKAMIQQIGAEATTKVRDEYFGLVVASKVEFATIDSR